MVATIVERLAVSDRTARDWLKQWQAAGYLRPARVDARRVHAYLLAEPWHPLLLSRTTTALPGAENSGNLKPK